MLAEVSCGIHKANGLPKISTVITEALIIGENAQTIITFLTYILTCLNNQEQLHTRDDSQPSEYYKGFKVQINNK